MKRWICSLGSLLICGSLLLTGCSAPEILHGVADSESHPSSSPTETSSSSTQTTTSSTANDETPGETTGGGETSAQETQGSTSAAAGTSSSSSAGSSTSASGSSTKPSGSNSNQQKPTNAKPTTTTTTTAKPTTSKPPTSKPSASNPTSPLKKSMVGYYTSWAASSGYTPSKIPVQKLTHIHYAFAKIDPSTGKIALPYPSSDKRNLQELVKLKQKAPHLKVLIAVGGWDYSGYFSDVAATATGREKFAQSCVDFIREYGLDGVDLDWEYPVSGGMSGNHNRPQDKQNFTLLLRALREKLNRQGAADNRTYLLTIAGAASTSYLNKIEPAAVASLVDHIFLMAYDLHGPWDAYSDLNAPLTTPAESSPQYKTSVTDAVNAYLRQGVPAGKLVLGMPFYGYRYSGVSGNGLYSSYSSAASISYDTLRSSYLNNAAYTVVRHASGVPYLYGKGTFISYDDPTSIAAKVRFAKSKSLAGAGAWALHHDAGGVLLDSAYRALLG